MRPPLLGWMVRPASPKAALRLCWTPTSTVSDAELSAADNFNGATLTLARNGGATSQDLFSGHWHPGRAHLQGGNLVVGATTIGTVTTNSSGTLVLTFNASATNALVNSALQQIAYANGSDAPPGERAGRLGLQ